jgi:putative secretion ATPase (PEP-CTERM system associated)
MFDDFYGLTDRPFQLTPDPAFYFETLTHRKALSYLSYGLAQSEGFVDVTGEIGSGKSTLVAYLMTTIDPVRLTAAQIVTSSLDGEELVHVVARAFGLLLAGDDKASARCAIEGFLHDEARAGRRCLLIVDEAQNLSVDGLEELHMLSNFQLGSHPLLQTLLLGQPEFCETLLERPELEQLRQRVIATYHLEAMEANEVKAYIEHRLKCVGWQGHPSFDQRVFAEVYAATGGVPRQINQIVNRLLMLGAVDRRSHFDGAMLRQVVNELGCDAAPSRPAVKPDPAPAPAQSQPLAEPHPSNAGHEFAAALAERDAQIAELQLAVVELADRIEHAPAGEAAMLQDRIAALEIHVAEQDRCLRHVLTMLIEWIEAENDARAAA